MADPASNGGGAQGGYMGLGHILDFLTGAGQMAGGQGSIFDRLSRGYTGNAQADNVGKGQAGVGAGVNGAFAGLSPWAASYLMKTFMNKVDTSKLAGYHDMSQIDQTADPNGYWLANLQNSLLAKGPGAYTLHEGLTADNLLQTLQEARAAGELGAGHGIFANGYNAQGKLPPPANNGGGDTHDHAHILGSRPGVGQPGHKYGKWDPKTGKWIPWKKSH